MERDRLVTISLDITTFLEKQTQINDRLTTLLESLGYPPANGQEDAPPPVP